MRSRSILVIGFFALILAAAATAVVVMYLQRTTKLAQAGPRLTPVVVSSSDLSFGHTLAPSNLKVAMFPATSVPKGAVSSVDSLVGQTTKVFLAQDEPVLVSKLSSIGGGLSLKINPPMRGVSINVDRASGVSGFILPGDRVDVICIVEQQGSSRQEAQAKTILQNIECLAAGEKTEKRGNEPIVMKEVTLLVDMDGAKKLALAQSEGKLHLSLRNPNDVDFAVETKPLSTKELLGFKPPEDQPRQTVAKKTEPKVEPPKVIVRPTDTLTIFRGTDASKEKPAMEKKPPMSGDTFNKPPGD